MIMMGRWVTCCLSRSGEAETFPSFRRLGCFHGVELAQKFLDTSSTMARVDLKSRLLADSLGLPDGDVNACREPMAKGGAFPEHVASWALAGSEGSISPGSKALESSPSTLVTAKEKCPCGSGKVFSDCHGTVRSYRPKPATQEEIRMIDSALVVELREIREWADGNEKDAVHDRLAYWSLKVPALLCSSGAAVFERLDMGVGVTICGVIAAVCVGIDAAHPLGRLHNAHKQASHDLSRLHNTIRSRFRRAQLAKASTPELLELLDLATFGRDSVWRRLRLAEASLGGGALANEATKADTSTEHSNAPMDMDTVPANFPPEHREQGV